MNNVIPIHNYCDAKTDSHLSSLLGIEVDLLQKVALLKNRDQFYNQYYITKRKNNYKIKRRLVWETKTRFLNNVYKNFAFRFGEFATQKESIHKSAFGYVRKIGTRENANVHKGRSLLLRADISNFFPSITIDKLSKIFEKLCLNKDIIQVLGEFLTIDKCLPIGLPSSPMLANIVCKELDEQINNLALKYNCNYTRYADDISISGEIKLPTKKELFDIILAEDFQPCESKFRVTKKGQAHYVTGLSVSDTKMPHAPRALRKKLRQELYYCNKFGIKSHFTKTNVKGNIIQSRINQLHGMVCYIYHIEGRPDLLKQWCLLLQHNQCEVSYKTSQSRPHEPSLNLVEQVSLELTSILEIQKKQNEYKRIEFYIDETEISHTSYKYLAIAFCAINSDVKKTVSIDIKSILDEYIANPYTGSDKNALKKENLHFNTADYELRKNCAKYLCKKDFKTYISYCKNTGNYSDSYIKLINKLLPRVLKKKEYREVKIIFNFEQNNKVETYQIKRAIGMIMLCNHSSLYEINIVDKSDFLVTIPDFMASVFNQYITAVATHDETKNHSFQIRMFEEFRQRYTSILNADKNIWYAGNDRYDASEETKENVKA